MSVSVLLEASASLSFQYSWCTNQRHRRKRNTSTYKKVAVSNYLTAYSCFSCHGRGLLPCMYGIRNTSHSRTSRALSAGPCPFKWQTDAATNALLCAALRPCDRPAWRPSIFRRANPFHPRQGQKGAVPACPDPAERPSQHSDFCIHTQPSKA